MLTDVSEVRTASIIALIMEAVRTSETSVNIYFITRQYNPEDTKLHTIRRENLKPHLQNYNHKINLKMDVVMEREFRFLNKLS
jgi:hypothetical protein